MSQWHKHSTEFMEIIAWKARIAYTLLEHPRFLGGVVLLIFLVFLHCPILCLYVLSSMLWCPLRFPHKYDAQFVFTSRCLCSCLICVDCVWLLIVVSNTFCIVFLFVFVLSTLCCQFLRIVYFWSPLRYSLTFV